MTVFWDVAPCSLVEVYRSFRGVCCRPDDGGSKHLTSVTFYQTTRRNIPEDSHLHTRISPSSRLVKLEILLHSRLLGGCNNIAFQHDLTSRPGFGTGELSLSNNENSLT
jgi:hypothetical protein